MSSNSPCVSLGLVLEETAALFSMQFFCPTVRWRLWVCLSPLQCVQTLFSRRWCCSHFKNIFAMKHTGQCGDAEWTQVEIVSWSTPQADVGNTMESDPAEWTTFTLTSWSFMTGSVLGILPANASLDKKHTHTSCAVVSFFVFYFLFFFVWIWKFASRVNFKLFSSRPLIDPRLQAVSRRR